jgi:hypothetical protein
MNSMKDHELRAVVLQRFYELRGQINRSWKPEDLGNEAEVAADDFYRTCDQLAEHGLIEWQPIRGSRIGHLFTRGGLGQITAKGVDVIEGTTQSPISITLDHRQTVSISGSNNIVGDHNLMNVEEISLAISHSNFSETEKAEAKSLWQKVSENKILNTVIGSICGAATKHALESAHPK